MTTFEKVRDVIADRLNIDKAKVTPQSSLTNDLGADSLDIVELVMELEKEFNITISDEDAGKIQQNVQSVIDYIDEHVKKTAKANEPIKKTA